MKYSKHIFVGLMVANLVGLGRAWAESTIEQSVEVGFQQKEVNSSEAKFEEYREVPNGVTLDSYSLKRTGGSSVLELELEKIRQEDQSASFELDKGRLGIEGSWNQTPHLLSNVAVTPYSLSGRDRLIAPYQIRKDIQTSTAAYTALSDVLHPVELGIQTNKGAINVDYAFSNRLRGQVGVSETIKKGNKALGASFTRSHVVQVAIPVDNKTYDTNLEFGYSGKTLQWNLGYGLSAFQNKIETITLDNPRRVTDSNGEAAQGRLNTYSDNFAQFGSLSAGLNMGAKTRATADLQVSYLRQDQPLLPFTINAASSPSNGANWTSRALPSASANASVVNIEQNYKLMSRLFNVLNTALRYRNFQQNNRTPEYTFDGSVGLDFNYSNTDTHNHAFEFKKETAGAEMDFNIVSALSLGLGYDMTWMQREHREVRDQEEGLASVNLDYAPVKGFLIRGTYKNSERRMRDFEVEDLVDAGETPGMRRYDVSDRDQNDGALLIQLNTAKSNLAVRGTLGYDTYKPGKGDLASLSIASSTNLSTMYGLINARRSGAGMDLDVQLPHDVSLFTSFDYQLERSFQRSNSNNHGNPPSQDLATQWGAQTTDEYQSAGLGVSAPLGKASLTLGYDLSRSRQSIEYVEQGTLVSNVMNPPTSRTTKQVCYVETKVPVTPALSMGLGYVFEKYDVYDWANDGVPAVNNSNYTPNYPGTNPNARELYLADSVNDYDAHIVSAKVSYKF